MAAWVEINGSPNYRKGPGSTRTLTRLFHTDKDAGLAQASAHGYIQGAILIHDGETLCITQVNPYNEDGHDLVQIVWENVSPDTAASRNPYYNDGVQRFDGEEEWTFSGGMESENISADTRSMNGSTAWMSAPPPGYAIGKPLLVPGLYLVWKKWFRTAVSQGGGGITVNRTVPRTKLSAIAAVESYLPEGSGGYETGGAAAPKMGKRLGPEGTEKRFLCTDIGIEPDGDLVCRTATFRYTRDPEGWLCPPYLE